MSSNKDRALSKLQDKEIHIPVGIDKVGEFIEFCEWRALPKSMRNPTNQTEFCKVLGVDPATLSLWKRYPEFRENLFHFTKLWLGDDVPDLMASAKKYAIRGSSKHLEIIMEWLGQMNRDTTFNIDNRKVVFEVKLDSGDNDFKKE